MIHEKQMTYALSTEDLEAQSAELLPDRAAMALVNAQVNAAVPVNAAVAANVLTSDSTADADADQTGDIKQGNLGF